MEVRLVITSLHALYAVMRKRNEGVLRQNSMKIREFGNYVRTFVSEGKERGNFGLSISL